MEPWRRASVHENQGRVVLPNYPLHVVQRGHNRQVVFAEDEDYQRYLSDLRDLKDAFGIKVYAFCLMTNHVHLLLAPGDSLSGLAQLMKTLGYILPITCSK
ncbi:transposase-like p;rotein [Pseudomonas aeruginosa PA38182]|nr:transposase-like p;rotein [Pseudomonas aeruginosa PA38182]